MWCPDPAERRYILTVCAHALMYAYSVAALVYLGTRARVEPLASVPAPLYWSLVAAHALSAPVALYCMVRVGSRGVERARASTTLLDLEFAQHKRAARRPHNAARPPRYGMRVD